MSSYLEQSIPAYKLLNNVTKALNIDESPEMSVKNGNVVKIISLCNAIIDEKYKHKQTKEILKYYIAHSFFVDYDLESKEDYSKKVIN